MNGVDTETIDTVLDLEPIGIIGCSRSPGKPAHDVPRYLRDRGVDIIPINPFADRILDRPTYGSLRDVPEPVPVVTVFRPSEEVPDVVDTVLARSDVDVLWLQLGITHPTASQRAVDAGLTVIADRCMKIEHERRDRSAS